MLYGTWSYLQQRRLSKRFSDYVICSYDFSQLRLCCSAAQLRTPRSPNDRVRTIATRWDCDYESPSKQINFTPVLPLPCNIGTVRCVLTLAMCKSTEDSYENKNTLRIDRMETGLAPLEARSTPMTQYIADITQWCGKYCCSDRIWKRLNSQSVPTMTH